jgi:hypothetical protein
VTSNVLDLIQSCKISEVWERLGGEPLVRGRGKAFWRKGAGRNVSVRDDKNVWRDHVTGAGGGVLDLIVQVRGCSRRDAVSTLNEITGKVFWSPDQPLSPIERAQRDQKERRLKALLPTARLWRGVALLFGEEILESLKSALDDPLAAAVNVGVVAFWTSRIESWKRLRGAELVEEYQQWVQRDPAFADAMVQAGSLRQFVDRRVIDRLIAYKGLSLIGGTAR